MLLIIGLLLVAAAITVGIDVAALNNYSVDVEAFGQVWTSSPAMVFVAGAVTALVGAIGVALVVDGSRRMRATRSKRSERERLADERQRQLEHQSELAGGRPTVDERDSADVDLRDRDRERTRTR
jgi:hypothetical protein